MRTPWREALDGKAKVIRNLKTSLTFNALADFFENSGSLKRLVGEARLKEAAGQIAVEFAMRCSTAVARSEPFWVWDSIADQIHQHIIIPGTPQKDPKNLRDTPPFRVTDLPVPEGLIWFQRPVLVGLDASTEPLYVPEMNVRVGCIRVQAIFWGVADTISVTPDKRLEFRQEKGQLGVVLFMDAKSLAPDTNLNSLVPWKSSTMFEGDTLQQYASTVESNTPGMKGADHYVSVWPVAFCLEFFRLLQQKLLLWGGSGVEREARKEAQRNGFDPTVRVVEWRKAQYKYPKDHVVTPGDWSCQWAVRSHMRRLKSGKVVTVRSYIKGPEDKPLKPIDQRIHVVKR